MEYAEKHDIKRWKIIKVVVMLKSNQPITFIASSQKLSIQRVLDIEVSFVKNTKVIETIQGSRRYPYHSNELEMKRQDYDKCVLSGWELEVFKSKN